MRWVSKPPRAEPSSGDWRKRKGFLIFPKKDEATKTYRWLEISEWEEVYTYLGSTGDGDSRYGWVCHKWLNE